MNCHDLIQKIFTLWPLLRNLTFLHWWWFNTQQLSSSPDQTLKINLNWSQDQIYYLSRKYMHLYRTMHFISRKCSILLYKLQLITNYGKLIMFSKCWTHKKNDNNNKCMNVLLLLWKCLDTVLVGPQGTGCFHLLSVHLYYTHLSLGHC